MPSKLQSVYPISGLGATPPAGGGGIGVFDSAEALAINRARLSHLASLELPLSDRTVLDVGCGVGHLSRFFVERNCRVACVDGRAENINALKTRYPGTNASVLNVESESLARMGSFDVVFSYGLLYHLENPVGGLRNMAQVCNDLLLLETVVTDHAEPVTRLLDEPPETPNQALGPLGSRPSPAFVTLALSRVGFRYIYQPQSPPDHPDFQFGWHNNLDFRREGHLLRCIFVASRRPLNNPNLSLLLEAPGAGEPRLYTPASSSQTADRVWLDVGAHLGEKTFSAAERDARLRVYAFEPNLSVASRRMGQLPNFVVLPMAVAEQDGSAEFFVNWFDAASSILPMNPEGLEKWIGGEELAETIPCRVPTIRLDTFLNGAGIRQVDFLKIDAQGADLAVIRSAGERLRDIQRISLEVQITPVPLYQGSSERAAVLQYMEQAGFQLVHVERQSHDQEENLTFERRKTRWWSDPAQALEAARQAVFVRPLSPYPAWNFGADWDNLDPEYQARRRIWEYFHDRKLGLPFVFEWYDRIRLNLYLGNDLSRQLFIAGCVEPNEFAFLAQVLTPGMVFVDGGANEGLYTLFAARRVGSSGVVLSVEPSAREFDRLNQNVRLNELHNVRLHRLALAEQDGEADLAIAGYEHEGQNTLGEFVHQGVALERTERVPVRRLDSLAAAERLERLDVLKLDVEGAELRVLLGARETLRKFRPVLLFEVAEPALRKQGGTFDQIREFLGSLQYILFAFDRDGRPAPAASGIASDNMIAVPQEKPLADRLASRPSRGFAAQGELEQSEPLPALSSGPSFNPAKAYWNQRSILAGERSRILALSQAVAHPHDLPLYQWAQLMAAVIDYAPDLVLELGRGPGNSTCAFTEAAHVNQGRTRVLSLCLSDVWERHTLPRLQTVVTTDWFKLLQALRKDILEFDYSQTLASAQRVIVFWDAHGFEVAECVLGCILPALAGKDHLVIMHDLSDSRYCSEEHLDYGEHGLWKGNNWSGPRLKLGLIDTAVEQSIATLDFTTRNHLTLDSADHSFRTELTPPHQAEMSRILGDLFDLQGHWFYFSLNERPGPYRFPLYTRPSMRVKSEEQRPPKRRRFFGR